MDPGESGESIVIIARVEGAIRVVRQVDHQEQCALMADAWGNDRFARPDHFAALRRAAAIHDEGWRSWERHPGVEPGGTPTDFPQIDRATHMRLYADGIAHACARDPRVGLLVSLHGRGLYEKRLGLDGQPGARSERSAGERTFLDGEIARQRRLADGLGMSDALDEWSWAAYRLLQAWDQLSLYLVWTPLATGRDGSLVRVPRKAGDEKGVSIALRPIDDTTCTADPWPFASDEVTFPVACRLIEDRTYRDREDLTAALAAARWETVNPRIHAV